MTVILILLGSIAGVGALLYLHHRLAGRAGGGAERSAASATDAEAAPAAPESAVQQQECCGMHIACEKDSLLAGLSPTIEYYDDEELDRYAGRPADGYTAAEADEFRDVLLTMRAEEVAGWARSLQARGIALPAEVRDELVLLVAERRAELSRAGSSG